MININLLSDPIFKFCQYICYFNSLMDLFSLSRLILFNVREDYESKINNSKLASPKAMLGKIYLQ